MGDGAEYRVLLKRVVAASGLGAGAAGPLLDRAIVNAAEVEGVAPLLGAKCARGNAVAGDCQGRLIRAYQQCLARNILREELLSPVFDQLERRDVPAILLKGAAVVRWAYDDLGARDMGDVDVLVPAPRWDEALAALAAAGARLEGRPRTHQLDYAVQAVLGSARLDLHRYLCARPMFRVDYDAIFASARRAGRFFIQNPEHTFVSLAIHAAKHGFVMPLRSVMDGFAIIRHGLQAKHVEDVARRWCARRATARWLQLLCRLGLDDATWLGVSERLSSGCSIGLGLPRNAPRSRRGNLWASSAELWVEALRSLDGNERRALTLVERARLRASNILAERRLHRGDRTP